MNLETVTDSLIKFITSELARDTKLEPWQHRLSIAQRVGGYVAGYCANDLESALKMAYEITVWVYGSSLESQARISFVTTVHRAIQDMWSVTRG